MDFDKWMPEKREIENLDSCYMNFEEMNPQFSADPSLCPFSGSRETDHAPSGVPQERHALKKKEHP